MTPPVPRYCCMRRESSDVGFGFSLIATRKETGQFIEEVKPDSLADQAGLKDGDLVVEVNGRNILTLSHPEVVEFIRRQGNEVFLLVLDEEARVYYEQQSIIPTHTMPEVKCIRSWEAPPKLAVESVDISKLTLQENPEEKLENGHSKELSPPSEGTAMHPPTISVTEASMENLANISPQAEVTTEHPAPEKSEVKVEDLQKHQEDVRPHVQLEESKYVDEAEVEMQEKAPNHNEEVHVSILVEEKSQEEEIEVVREMVEKPSTPEPEAPRSPVAPSGAAADTSVSNLPDLSSKSILQSRQSIGARFTPSRRACMGAMATFGDKAKAFDEL